MKLEAISGTHAGRNTFGHPTRWRLVTAPFDFTYGEPHKVCSCCGSLMYDWNYEVNTNHRRDFKAFITQPTLGVLIVVNSPGNEADCVTENYIVQTHVIDGVNVSFQFNMRRD